MMYCLSKNALKTRRSSWQKSLLLLIIFFLFSSQNATHISTKFVFNERHLNKVPTIASVSLKFNIVDLHGEGVCTRSGIEYDCCELMVKPHSAFLCAGIDC